MATLQERTSLLPDPLGQPVSSAVSYSQERFHHSRSWWRMICVLHPVVGLQAFIVLFFAYTVQGFFGLTYATLRESA